MKIPLDYTKPDIKEQLQKLYQHCHRVVVSAIENRTLTQEQIDRLQDASKKILSILGGIK